MRTASFGHKMQRLDMYMKGRDTYVINIPKIGESVPKSHHVTRIDDNSLVSFAIVAAFREWAYI